MWFQIALLFLFVFFVLSSFLPAFLALLALGKPLQVLPVVRVVGLEQEFACFCVVFVLFSGGFAVFCLQSRQ